MDTWVGGRRPRKGARAPWSPLAGVGGHERVGAGALLVTPCPRGPSRPCPTPTPLAGFLAGAQLGAGSGAPRPQSAALHPRHCGRHGRPSGHGSALRHAGAEADSGSSLLRACLGSR